MSESDQTTILVTGSAGNVGTELVKQLSNSDAIFRAGVHSSESADKIRKISSRAQLVQLDYDKPETLSRACDGVNKIFLLTPGSPRAVEFAFNLVNEAKRAGVMHIVRQSVLGADAIPGIRPGRLHRQVEKIIEESRIPYTFLRPNFFMQNFVNFYSSIIKSQGVIYAPAGDGKVSFVDVRDIAGVAANVLTEHDESGRRHIGKAYDITGPEALSYYQTAEILSNALGKKINYVNIPEADARRGMKDMGMDEWTINIYLELLENYRKGYASQVSDGVESITGNKPISFHQFAKEYVGAFR